MVDSFHRSEETLLYHFLYLASIFIFSICLEIGLILIIHPSVFLIPFGVAGLSEPVPATVEQRLLNNFHLSLFSFCVTLKQREKEILNGSTSLIGHIRKHPSTMTKRQRW